MSSLILVDDEKIILDSLSRYISQCLPEFEICGSFYDGEDALQYLLEHPVDIVITDISMPNMDGLQLAREICNRLPHCITIIISGYSEFEYARTAIKYNVLNYLLKPLDFRELKKTLLEADALSRTRTAPATTLPNLHAEETEVFFTNLLMGLISSPEELEQQFAHLQFPFPLSQSQGCIIRLSISREEFEQNFNYNIDQLEITLKNMLQLSLPDIPLYFVRRSDYHFYYILFGRDSEQRLKTCSFTQNTLELIGLHCIILPYQSFSSLLRLIPSDLPASSASVVPSASKTVPNDTAIRKAMEYIDQNYHLDLTREMVADAVFLSPSYFSYQFKKRAGISFFDYLTNVRMQKAIELLSTRMKVGDIAQKVGYQSRNRFFINFRQYTSYTPTEYRKIVLSMGDSVDEK